MERVIKEIAGRIIWLLIPILLLDLILIPFCEYKLSTSWILVFFVLFILCFIFLEWFPKMMSRDFTVEETNKMGPVTVEIRAQSSGSATFALCFYTTVFVVLSFIAGHMVYGKTMHVVFSHHAPDPYNIIMLDSLAIFLFARSFISFVKKRRLKTKTC